MEFSGEHRIPARQQRVWNALSDPAVMKACIPGCSRVDKLSDSEMVATVVVAVGPISATFKGDVSLNSLSVPIGYTLTAQDGATDLAKIQAQVWLAEDRGQTVLKYVASAEIGDKLASIGGWLAQTVAKMNVDDFFAAFARQLSATRVQEPVAPVAVAESGARSSHAVLATAAKPAGRSSAPAAPMPVRLVVFAIGIGFVLGYCFARFL
jgi:uncharacterized protein